MEEIGTPVDIKVLEDTPIKMVDKSKSTLIRKKSNSHTHKTII